MMYGGGMGPYSKPKGGKKMDVGLPKRRKGKLNRRTSKPRSLNLGSLGKGKM